MKILHLNDIAGVPRILADAQKKIGLDAEVVALNTARFAPDRVVTNPISRLLLLKYKIRHLHSCSTLPFYLDSNLKAIWHHHGTDIRDKKCFGKRGVHLVSTPDLLEFCQDSTWLPNPVWIEPHTLPNESNFTITYGYKDKDAIEEALRDTKYKLIPIVGIEPSKVKELLIKSSVFIDSFTYPFYSYLATQAMALGRPVIGKTSPILSCSLKELPSTLETLNLKELQKKSLTYIKKHDAIPIAKITKKIYEDEFGEDN